MITIVNEMIIVLKPVDTTWLYVCIKYTYEHEKFNQFAQYFWGKNTFYHSVFKEYEIYLIYAITFCRKK